jgi:hypothetical protein
LSERLQRDSCLGLLRIDSQGLAEFTNRSFDLSLLDEDGAKVRMRAGVVGIDRQDARQLARRPLDLTQIKKIHGQIGPRVDVSRVAFECALVLVDRLPPPTASRQHEPQVVVRRRIIDQLQRAPQI